MHQTHSESMQWLLANYSIKLCSGYQAVRKCVNALLKEETSQCGWHLHILPLISPYCSHRGVHAGMGECMEESTLIVNEATHVQ